MPLVGAPAFANNNLFNNRLNNNGLWANNQNNLFAQAPQPLFGNNLYNNNNNWGQPLFGGVQQQRPNLLGTIFGGMYNNNPNPMYDEDEEEEEDEDYDEDGDGDYSD